MQPVHNRLEYLFQQYFDKTATPEERAELAELMEDDANKDTLMQLFSGSWERYAGDGAIISSTRSQAMLEQIVRHEAAQPPVIMPARRRTRWWLAAAAAVLVVAAGVVWMSSRRERTTVQPPVIATVPQDVQPGSNGAVLTLDNGRRIILDSAHNGLLAQQGNATVTKQQDALVYSGAGAAGKATAYNMISTPRGRQYPNLVLEDGTKVWLDAGSSIRFPVVFNGTERKVEITGQVWFDVKHNAQRPFKVMARGIEINDLGTQFNVNAYEDEAKTKITLLEGAVSIGNVLLKPGQQAQVPAQGAIQVSEQADLDQVMAWKNGIFFFTNADIKTVMREVARWYDIEVVYEGQRYTETFSGKIARGLTLRELLEGLAQTRVRYRIEDGKKLVILPQ